MQRHEQRYRIGERIRRLHELGFDVDEVELIDDPAGGSRLRLRRAWPNPAGTGGSCWRSPASTSGRTRPAGCWPTSPASAAGWSRWSGGACPWPSPPAAGSPRSTGRRSTAIPAHLRNRLDEAEIFHEILEHRWFLSEAAGVDVGTSAAAEDYFERVLPDRPEDLVTPAAAVVEDDVDGD